MRGSERSPASSSGCAWAPARDRQRARPALQRTNNSSPRPATRKTVTRELEIAIPPGPRLGDQVIEVQGLRKGFGDRLLIEDLSFSLPRSGIVGIIGPNGAGKTTLFRMLVGQEAPDAGTIDIGETVAMSYVDQSRDELRADRTVFEEITDGVEVVKAGTREVPARAYVQQLQLPRHRSAEARRDALGRRAQPRPPREAPPVERQRAAAR